MRGHAGVQSTPAHAGEETSLEQFKSRCLSLRDSLLLSTKLPESPKLSLLRLVEAELRYLSRLHPPFFGPISPNLGHLEAVFHVINHPAIHSVSRVCKPVGPLHVDVTCNFRREPAWVFVSGRNPKFVSWVGSSDGESKGYRGRVSGALAAASEAGALKPHKLVFIFARGLGESVERGFLDEIGATKIDLMDEFDVFDELEEGWVAVRTVITEELKQFSGFQVFEIKIGEDCLEKSISLSDLGEQEGLDLGTEFGTLVSKMRSSGTDLINFDTTALIAMVSGISNGDSERLLNGPEDELRARFKCNYEFVIAQAMSELEEHPILVQLGKFIAGKKGIICQSVLSEFNEIVSMCGGLTEKTRAAVLLKHLSVVPDNPSERVTDLPTTRKLALKNKIVFGTGDTWHAPTLTANMGFVRAVAQTGMSLLTIEHSPRALTGV